MKYKVVYWGMENMLRIWAASWLQQVLKFINEHTVHVKIHGISGWYETKTFGETCYSFSEDGCGIHWLMNWLKKKSSPECRTCMFASTKLELVYCVDFKESIRVASSMQNVIGLKASHGIYIWRKSEHNSVTIGTTEYFHPLLNPCQNLKL